MAGDYQSLWETFERTLRGIKWDPPKTHWVCEACRCAGGQERPALTISCVFPGEQPCAECGAMHPQEGLSLVYKLVRVGPEKPR